MKKILSIFIILLCISIVTAQGEKGNRITTNIKGLENAMLRVKNNESILHLEQVMEKIKEQKRARLNQLEGLEIRENIEKVGEFKEVKRVIAEGKKEAKLFYFIKLKKSYQYEINEETGNTIRIKRWYDIFWKDLE